MLRPDEFIGITNKSVERLKSSYFKKKDEYFELCFQYNLPPRDLSLFLMGKSNLGDDDRIRLIRLVIQLMDMEKLLAPGAVEDYLFPENESHYVNSEIFKRNLH